MKGSEAVIKVLNEQLADELTAVNQYMVHASMCGNWGYEKLHGLIEKRAIEEMKHAEMHIDRILFLNGTPTVSKLNKVVIGADVQTQLKNDLEAELGAIVTYNAAIKLCADQNDHGTRDLLVSILKDEEAHLDWLEAQLDQIEQIGIQNYLVEQLG
jgi:bacterioferritin